MSAVLRVLIFAALILLATGVRSRADDLPCPPKHYFCLEARLAFKTWGVPRVVAKARACGWTSDEIDEARKCLSKTQAKERQP